MAATSPASASSTYTPYGPAAEDGAGNSMAIMIGVVVSLVCIAAVVAAVFVLYKKRKHHARSKVDHALCCVATRAGVLERDGSCCVATCGTALSPAVRCPVSTCRGWSS